MIESIHYQLSKVTRAGADRSPPTNPLYLALRNIGSQRGGEAGIGTHGWKTALNAFAVQFPDCLPLQPPPNKIGRTPYAEDLTPSPGGPGMPWRSPPPSGSTGSTTAVSTSSAAKSHRSTSRMPTGVETELSKS